MTKLAAALLGLALTVSAFAKTELPPTIKALSKLIGGKWVATIDAGTQKVAIEFEFDWHPDKKGIVGKGIIGKGSAKPVYATVTLGWDAKAGKAYYLDTHNTETIYYGHITQEGEAFLYEFGALGSGDPKAFKSRDRFIGPDTRESEILDKNGKTIVKYQAKRIR